MHEIPQPLKVVIIASVCMHLAGDAVAAIRDGLAFVAVADVIALAMVAVLAYELRKARGYL